MNKDIMNDYNEVSDKVLKEVVKNNNISQMSCAVKILRQFFDKKKSSEQKDVIATAVSEPGSFRQCLSTMKLTGIISIRDSGYVTYIELTEKAFEEIDNIIKTKQDKEAIKTLANSGHKEKIIEYLKNQKDTILDLAVGYPNTHSLEIDFHKLETYDMDLAETLLSNPNTLIPLFNKQIKDILPPDMPTVNINIRFINLPAIHTINISELTTKHLGKLICIEGCVRIRNVPKPKLVLGAFECQACGAVEYKEQKNTKITKPHFCASCEKKSAPFELIHDESKTIDFQKAKLEEDFEKAKGNSPEDMVLHIKGDLIRKLEVGDYVSIVGILKTELKEGKTLFDTFFHVNSITEQKNTGRSEIKLTAQDKKDIIKLSKDPQIYEKLEGTIAPSIAGHSRVKEGILYQIFGSNSKKVSDGTTKRGDTHILMVGEPALGKSEIMCAVVELVKDRSKYVSTKSTVGLTASVVKDEAMDGNWAIKAGVLPLSSGGGIVAIDEFSELDKEDTSYMHEAMEQQTISVAKAGQIATLASKVSILTATNPIHGRFDPYKDVLKQVDISHPMLSRFDLIFFMQDDIKDAKAVAEKVVKTINNPDDIQLEIDPELFRKYRKYARQTCDPSLPQEIQDYIVAYYVDKKKTASLNNEGIPITARQLGAVVRLSKARARVRLSNKVTKSDVETVIDLINYSLEGVCMDEDGIVDVDKIFIGASKTQRSTINQLLPLIKDLEQDIRGPVMKSEILEAGLKDGLSKSDVENAMDTLLKEDQLYDPNNDERYKTV